MLVGCNPAIENPTTLDYIPRNGNDWQVSTPAKHELDPDLAAELYYNASRLETTYSLLVFKNGYLVAEDYFHIGSAEKKVNITSVTKSLTSVLAGIAQDQGCLSTVDQKMMEFFPELADRVRDPK